MSVFRKNGKSYSKKPDKNYLWTVTASCGRDLLPCKSIRWYPADISVFFFKDGRERKGTRADALEEKRNKPNLHGTFGNRYINKKKEKGERRWLSNKGIGMTIF